MNFLSWTNEDDAKDSLVAIDNELGCPYILDNGYRMDTWGIFSKSNARDEWGFFKPIDGLSKSIEELMLVVKEGFTEGDKPYDWNNIDEIEFIPTEIEPLSGWYDASDATTMEIVSNETVNTLIPSTPSTPDDAVSKWLEKSGEGNHVEQLVTSKPIYLASEMNNLNAISFNGIDDKLELATPSPSLSDFFHTGGTFFAVIKPLSEGRFNNPKGMICEWSHIVKIFVSDEESGMIKFRLNQSFNIANGEWSTLNADLTIGSENIIAITYDGSSDSNDPVFYVNGVSVPISEVSTPKGVIDTDTGSTFYVGNNEPSIQGHIDGFDGSIGELIFSKKILNTSELGLVFNYLTRWQEV